MYSLSINCQCISIYNTKLLISILIKYLFLLSIAIFCQDLAPLVNGTISYSPDTKQPFDLGTVALQECNTGFRLLGPENRTCVEDKLVGVFTESAPICERNRFCNATSSIFIAIIYQAVMTIQCCFFSNSNCL